MKILLDITSIPQICIPTARGTFQEAQERGICPLDLKERWESPKDLTKSCCHCIKCTITTFLATCMWRRHLNSETLVITTHIEPEDVADGTDIQVKSQINDKCRVKMIKKEIYYVKNPLCKEEREKGRRERRRRSLTRITYKKDCLI